MLRRGGLVLLLLAGGSVDCDDQLYAMKTLLIQALAARMAMAMGLRLLRLVQALWVVRSVKGRRRGRSGSSGGELT